MGHVRHVHELGRRRHLRTELEETHPMPGGVVWKMECTSCVQCAILEYFLIDILTPSRSSWDPDDPSIGRGSSKWDIPSPAPSGDSGIDTKRLTNAFGSTTVLF